MAMLLQAPQASGVTSPQTILPAGKVDSATRGFFAVVGWKDNRARSGTVPSVQSNCGDTARAWRVPNYPIRRPSVRILPETQSCVRAKLVFCTPCLFRHSVTHWPCGVVDDGIVGFVAHRFLYKLLHRFVKIDTWISQVVSVRWICQN